MNKEQERILNDIHSCIVGNEYQVGLLERLKKVEKQSKINKFLFGFITALTSLIAVLFGSK